MDTGLSMRLPGWDTCVRHHRVHNAQNESNKCGGNDLDRCGIGAVPVRPHRREMVSSSRCSRRRHTGCAASCFRQTTSGTSLPRRLEKLVVRAVPRGIPAAVGAEKGVSRLTATSIRTLLFSEILILLLHFFFLRCWFREL